MSKPDHISKGYSLVTFSGPSVREAMVSLLNWMDEPAGGTYKKADGTIGHLQYNNDFYCLDETIHVEHDHEYDFFAVSILVGKIPNAEEDQR